SNVQVLTDQDMPLSVEVAEPAKVGLDRLANAVAALALRSTGASAIIVGVGSAIVVDLVRANGQFAGGAILPGLRTAAYALHDHTDMLPLVEIVESPPPLGRSTIDAMRSGLFWGAIGAVRELIDQLAKDAGAVEVFLTGGDAPALAGVLAERSELPLEY